MDKKPDRWGPSFPSPGYQPEHTFGEYVWVKQRDDGSFISIADGIKWCPHTWTDEEDIISYRLREDHPAYMTHTQKPPLDIEALEDNPMFGQF